MMLKSNNDQPEMGIPILGLDEQDKLSGEDPVPDHPLPWQGGRDERWTKLQFARDHVLVNERRPPRWLFGILALSLLAFGVAAPHLPMTPESIVFVLVGLSMMLYFLLTVVRVHRFFQCYLARPQAALPEDGSDVIPISRIVAIIVREETNLDGDVGPLVQLVLRLREPDEYVLVGSHYHALRKRLIRTARELEAWLNEQTE